MKENKKISIKDNCQSLSKIDETYPAVVEYPNNIMIEVTNACNLKCKMCYHKSMKRKIGFISEELFNKVINEARELNINNIGLYTVGESFIHPKIFDFIKIAKNKGIEYVYITTNGLLLNESKINKILDSGLDSIKFSIDAASKEAYENIRIGGKWDKLIDNIRLLRELRDKSKSKLRIFASFMVAEENYQDLFKYNSFFKDLIDETLFSFISNQGGQVIVNSMIPNKIREKLSKLVLPKEKWHPCHLLWNRFIVNYDGKLTICCIDFDAKLIYGDLNKNKLKDCWNNTKMQEFRKIHRKGKFDLIPLCVKCDAIKRDNSILKRLTLEIKDMVDEGQPVIMSEANDY